MTTIRPRLHLLLTPEALADCRGQLQCGDRLVLLDQAAALVSDPDLPGQLPDAVVMAVSGPDLAARALPLPAAIEALDDRQLVQLIAGCEQLLSWA